MAKGKAKEQGVVITETPFDKRHCCWFCGEPSHVDFVFPPNNTLTSYHETKYLLLSCPHPTISVPCCGECQNLAARAEVDNIWSVNLYVKQQLLKRHAKDLAIGVNWTKDELANSEFEDGNFSGFAKSAWFIYEVAKGRVSYKGWPLIANGLVLDSSVAEGECVEPFQFDGVVYPSVNDAIAHYGNTFKLDQHYMTAVLKQMSEGIIEKQLDGQSFSKAVRFCRALVDATPDKRKLAYRKLVSKSA